MTRGLWAILGVAALLRAMRALARWDEVSWQYAAYNGPLIESLGAQDWPAALTTMTGLHPPGVYALLGMGELLWPVPLLALGLAALASLGAVIAMARVHWLAGLAMALGPIQLHYAAELNNYPYLALLVALGWSHSQLRPSDWRGLGLLAGLAAWIHGLALISILAAAATVCGRTMVKVGGVAALIALPLWWPVLRLATDRGSYIQPTPQVALILADAWGRFGPWPILWLGFLALGARRRPRIMWAALGVAGFIWALQLARLAAPHQFPYWLALGPPAALLLVEARSAWRGAILPILVIQGLALGGRQALDLHTLMDAPAAGMELAWSRSLPGDAVILVAPPRTPDDDKRANSPSLWVLRPWQAMPLHRRSAVPLGEPSDGAPRVVQGRRVHVHDHVRSTILAATHEQGQSYVVATGARRQGQHGRALTQLLGVEPEVVGADLLFSLKR